MHNYCYKKSTAGCPWVRGTKLAPYSKHSPYTLSTRGYPCYWDHFDLSCAWCTPGSYQCGRSQKPENFCNKGPASTCNGQLWDCEHIPTCHMDATCQTVQNQKRCVCNDGFLGNGIQCANQQTGTVGVNPETVVTVEASFSRDFVTKNTGLFPEQEQIQTAISSVDSLCNGAFSSCSSQLNVTGTD